MTLAAKRRLNMATIYHQVWINAPTAKVYDAIATGEAIGSWWDKQTATETDSGLVLEHNPGPEHGVVQLKVLQMVPDKRIEWECISTHPKSSPASAWTGTHFSFAISERENRAILDFRHSG
jgi:uncharacterized protein YndB with AHSA1/START domain